MAKPYDALVERKLTEARSTVKKYEFERTPEGHLRVHAAMGCGRAFNDIAMIVDPDSENPALHLPRPLGFNAVREIIAHHQSTKKGSTIQ